MPISVIVLTFNAEATIGATLKSAHAVSDDVHVVDSYSTDRTLEIARGLGAQIVQHSFENYAAQRNWAIDSSRLRHGWQLHLDADERLSDELAAEIKALELGAGDVAAYYLPRLVHFHGRPLRHGGMYPVYHLRLFRSGSTRVEPRKYDQHFLTSGKTAKLKGPMIDDIRLPLGEWTARHNRWADLEVEEILNPGAGAIRGGTGDPVAEKRSQREFYYRQPLFLRALLLFLYRYVWKLGFLDGKEGLVFYVLQTFWFRFLVDAKLDERRQAAAAAAAGKCLLCGGRTRLVLDHLTDNRFGSPGAWRIMACDSCGLAQTDPRPASGELKALYETYYNYGGETGTAYAAFRERLLMSPAYRLILAVDGDVSFHAETGSGRLLDVGCNEGRGLVLYRRNGFRPEGLELNPRAAEAARSRGFMVYETELAALKPSLPFDRVVMANVLEHTLDPRAALADVRRVLADGGEVWISLPNRRSWLRALFGRAWINWHVPFHITHFDAERLTRLLNDSGFTVIALRNETPALWVAQSVIARLLPGRFTAQRSAALVALLMLVARGLCFPALWLGNARGRGDCLVVKARKA